MVHEFLWPGAQGLDILYTTTREETKEIKDEEGRRNRERARDYNYHKFCKKNSNYCVGTEVA